ncbi:hypothetical protein N9Y42_05040, partial [Mariniblastus sp.]|nr:hypothetical protein [Mariniblastus sp.]
SGQACVYDALEAVIKPAPDRKSDQRLVVADSKLVYKSSGSIKNLETTVLSFLAAIGSRRSAEQGASEVELDAIPRSVENLVSLACPASDWLLLGALPAYDFSVVELPLKADPDEILENANRLRDATAAAQIELISIECLPVFPKEFNAGLRSYGNKATLLSNRTLEIVSRLKAMTNDDLEIVCDKHGGRNKYASLIKAHLTDQPICTGSETKLCSDYSFSDQQRDVVVRFQAGGESFMPTALASMVSKYVREVFMKAWNQFWIQQIPNLKPTKGYPLDAKRFKAEINELQSRLNIDDQDVWRLK